MSQTSKLIIHSKVGMVVRPEIGSVRGDSEVGFAGLQ